MRPVAQSDGHDEPGLIGELVPRFAAVVEDVAVGGEDAVVQIAVNEHVADIHAVGVSGRSYQRPSHYSQAVSG